jgi:hypothetical protein
MDADDEILEKDMFLDLNEAEMVGSTAQVKIVAQIDRYKGGSRSSDYQGGDDSSSTRRYLVTKDPQSDLETLTSPVLADLGEADMGNPKTLVDFTEWAIRTYPARKYALILSDHGMGWPGGWSDDKPVKGSQLRLDQIDAALEQIVRETGIGRLELVGFDACLMGQLEVLSALAPHARFAVASADMEPSLGWAYAGFLAKLVQNPAMEGRELGKTIVDSYIEQDWRITDARARRELVADQLDEEKTYSRAQITKVMSEDVTLAAVDLAQISGLDAAVNELALALAGAKQSQVAKARRYAQSYTNTFDDDLPPSYLDLGHFASQVEKQVENAAALAAAAKVKTALASAVIAEQHGSALRGATGMTIYFPNSTLYKQTFGKQADPVYLNDARRFATASLWDDYLTFHYTKKPFAANGADLGVLEPQGAAQKLDAGATAAALAADATVTAPGSAAIRITELKGSAKSIRLGGALTLDVVIEGGNVGYIYIYTLYYDKKADAYETVDVDFVDAGETRQVDGVYYPEWGDAAELEFEIDWEPLLNYLSNGKDIYELAPLEAETYGVGSEDTLYSLWGTWVSKESGAQREAVMRFDANGEWRGLFAFAGETAKAPHEVTPKPGDQFIIEEEWLSFDKNPDGELEYYDGAALTFGKKPFTIEVDDAVTGDYVVGIEVSDLDGNSYSEYVEVTVKK